MIELQGNIRETEKKHPADAECFSATRNGLEPSTSAVTGRRSNQLSHQALSSLCWTRTNDTAVNSRVLYRLSYEGLVELRGLEPGTDRL